MPRFSQCSTKREISASCWYHLDGWFVNIYLFYYSLFSHSPKLCFIYCYYEHWDYDYDFYHSLKKVHLSFSFGLLAEIALLTQSQFHVVGPHHMDLTIMKPALKPKAEHAGPWQRLQKSKVHPNRSCPVNLSHHTRAKKETILSRMSVLAFISFSFTGFTC